MQRDKNKVSVALVVDESKAAAAWVSGDNLYLRFTGSTGGKLRGM
jgi:hypothetical protein